MVVRSATLGDLPQVVPLLLADAARRAALDPVVWSILPEAEAAVERMLAAALGSGDQPFHQTWQVAVDGTQIVGIAHGMLLPVPPIYAGAWGAPGLVLPELYVAEGSEHRRAALLHGVEQNLRDAGARLFLTSEVPGDGLGVIYAAQGYAPLTLYLSKTGPGTGAAPGVRAATTDDLPDIVARSAEHRAIIAALEPFWTAHPEADTRFHRWMAHSLTLSDRDMVVSGDGAGYGIAQPASRLHFPAAHDIAGIGVLDDFYHRDLSAVNGSAGPGARALLAGVEAAFARRAMRAAFVVCPAEWPAKIALLQVAGYRKAMLWRIKRAAPAT